MKKPLTTLITGTVLALVLAGCAANTETDSSTTPSAPPTAEADPTPAEDAAAPASGDTPITLTSGDTVITATLNDSQVSQDFIAMLPVTLPWFRNSGIEYITELDSPLTEDGPFYTDVQPGDLVYWLIAAERVAEV